MIVDTVLRAATAGLHVFPCDPNGKTPLVYRGRRIPWGKCATTDPSIIRRWWAEVPDANYGIAAGHSGLLIIDCDMGKNGDPLPPALDGEGVNSGEDVFAAIAILLGQPFPLETLTVETPSGGAHYYYANPDGVKMTQSSLVKGWLDVRSNGGTDGGYVVGPGSTLDGREYRVRTRMPIAPAPDWLIGMCVHKEPPPRPATDRFLASGPPSSVRAAGPAQGTLNVVREAANGNQSAAIFWCACALLKDGFGRQEVVDAIWDNRPVDYGPKPWTYRDIESHVNSAARTVGT